MLFADKTSMNRKAKIVATIGPASQDETVVEKLLLAGMDVARLNFSHGTHETHAARISQSAGRLDAAWAVHWRFYRTCRAQRSVSVCCQSPLTLVPGQTVILYPGRQQTAGDCQQPASYPGGFPAIV